MEEEFKKELDILIRKYIDSTFTDIPSILLTESIMAHLSNVCSIYSETRMVIEDEQERIKNLYDVDTMSTT